MSGTDDSAAAPGDDADPAAVEAFIARWEKSGGAETANFQMFADELCDLLGLPRPDPAQELNELNDYVFERRVDFKHDDGTTTPGRIDLYRRGCFVMEAKQSGKRARAPAADPRQPGLLPEDAAQVKAGTALRGTRGWDKAMRKAKRQAEDYARALPKEHGWPPFLLVVDVGYVFEVYADFSGQGKNYAQFPDRAGYSIPLAGLRDPAIRARLRAVWTDPQSLDPAKRSAEVTRDIAERLAKIARNLEGKRDPKEVAEFLMRCLFTMFAEDVGLLPKQGFEKLLGDMIETPQNFAPALESLWRVMDEGGYAPHLNATVKRFNGALFRNRAAVALDKDDIRELWIAAARDWRDVEPAIFGTLLERALDERERAKLGAHYTPRAYVERLVVPTVIEPLRADWEEALTRAHEQEAAGDRDGALKTVKAFHHALCTTRVLDPACGTGNFLYVALELMKRLEGEVLDALDGLGEDAPRFAMEGETVSPRQFYGLELNPRAVAIADLVLWLGYLKWQLRTIPVARLPEPVLHAYGNIREQDAILAWDKQELLCGEDGKPLSRWDGFTTKLNPITGEEIPDPDATVEMYRYENPRRADWPEAEFIVGNPPFIGGKDMRAELGDGYAQACWQARPKIPGGADYVMHFWDEAAARLLSKPKKKDQKNPLRRFGFITTNSVTQTFSRRVIERRLKAREPLSLVYAVPDHPWLKAADKAAVRIAMTVAARGEREGKLATVERESGLNTDAPAVELREQASKIVSNLKIGSDITSVQPLLANDLISSPGVKLHGSGFIVTPPQAASLGLGRTPGLENHILPYRNGRDLAQRPRGVMVIDLYGLSSDEVRERFPKVFQHVTDRVKPERDQNNRKTYRENWWIFGEPRSDLRPVLEPLDRYIATIETSKHRFFQFLGADIRPDNRLVCVGVSDSSCLAVLSSRLHVIWALAVGGVLEDRPIYTKSSTFDPFPLGLEDDTGQLGTLGDRLDAFRKERIAEHDFLTMTMLYNVLERVRELENDCKVPPLSAKERDIRESGLVSVLKEIHDDIDCAALETYGWADLIPALVGKPGATAPSLRKTPEQAAAEEELLSRLVALNRERAEEERRGHVHWLRPDYQIPRLDHRAAPEAVQAEADFTAPAAGEPDWPEDGLDQLRAVAGMLRRAAAPLAAESLGKAFKGRNTAKRKRRVAEVLDALAETGPARQTPDGRYFIPR
ncbi:MAG: class I SAM-dependent DNA methyltransferase [Rhodospirillaceae bacterium]|nr:class I SAM-dependent DNA methyltransferase [Rhodospirillaceae bacterium]MYB13784.1 class I SAM-dependent DNA methyltransferase [Rhodospirillaceae bacterium]